MTELEVFEEYTKVALYLCQGCESLNKFDSHIKRCKNPRTQNLELSWCFDMIHKDTYESIYIERTADSEDNTYHAMIRLNDKDLVKQEIFTLIGLLDSTTISYDDANVYVNHTIHVYSKTESLMRLIDLITGLLPSFYEAYLHV